MKHVIMSLLMIILTGYFSEILSQSEGRERIEAQRVTFITQRLKLTPEESAKFWPVYNAYRDELKEIKDEWERPDWQNLSDADANKLLDQHIRQEERKLELKKQNITKLKQVLPPRKIIQLQVAENAFNRELLKRVQEHRDNR